jgi:hypothetical protein
VPVFGFYARHVKGLTLRNVQLTTAAPDGRPATAFIDVSDLETDAAPAPAPAKLR